MLAVRRQSKPCCRFVDVSTARRGHQTTKHTLQIRVHSVFHRAGRLKDAVTLHLVSSFCRPYFLYATERLGLTVTQMRSLSDTRQCAVSHVCNAVAFVCNAADGVTLHIMILKKRIKFIQDKNTFHSNHIVLHHLFSHVGKQELFTSRSLTV